MLYSRNDERVAACMYLLLYTFSDKIKYDYTMPEIDTIADMAQKAVDNMFEIPQDWKDFIYSCVAAKGDKYGPFASELENLLCSEWMFGREWFYGSGTYYRWRSDEIMKEAEAEIMEVLDVHQLEMLHQISQKMKTLKSNYKQLKNKSGQAD
jgi:hypothetical protein